jgi:photosystem II stability/assembly factor-like uncharacterized protein
MPEERAVLDEGVAGIDPLPDSYERVLRRARRRRVRRRVGVGLLAAVMFGGAAAGLWLGFFSANPRPVQRGSVRPEVTARTFLAQGVAGGIAAGDGSVWVPERTVLVRLDPVTLDPTATVRLPGPPDDSRRIAVGADAVWVSGVDRLLRLDPATERVTFSYPMGPVWSLAVGEGAVWVTHLGPPFTLSRIDPANNSVRSFQVSTSLSKWFGLAAGLGSVWTTNAGGNVCTGTGCLVRLDPSSGRVRSTVEGATGMVALGRGALWVSMASEVDRVDPGTGRIAARIRLPGNLHELGPVAASPDYVWTAAGSNLAVIDARTNRLVRAPFPPGVSPYAIAVSGSTAWVTSEEGVVVRVQLVPCRGSACRIAPSPPPTPAGGEVSVAISEVHMVSPTVGWATAEVEGRTLAVLHTTDGGASWTDVGPIRGRDYYEVFPFFLGPSHAWFGTARHRVVRIYRTADGGRIWETSSLRTTDPGGPLWFVNPEDGWFLAGGDNGTMGSEPLQVFQTTDGGSHWKRISVSIDAVPTSTPGPLSIGCDKGDIVFTRPDTGFVNVYCNSAGDVLFVTHDGGVTWQGETLPGLPCSQGCGASAPEFITPRVGFVQAGMSETLYLTSDGGATWTPLPPPPVRFGLPDFVAPSQGFVWIKGLLYVTADGGQSWTTIRPSVRLSSASLDFVNPRVGFAWVQGVRYVLRTVDGGHTWRRLPALLTP